MKDRQIDITKEDVRVCDELILESEYISATYELWMDVGKYFGIQTKGSGFLWISFFTEWYPDGKISAYYIAEYEGKKSDIRNWELNEEEEVFFRNAMEDFCQKHGSISLQEMWELYHNNEL